MFKRRKPLSLGQKLREFIWPSMGWKRTYTYLKHRIMRLPDTQRNIALGLAIGAGISFSPIMGTHIVQGIIIAYLLRANIIASVVGTIIGNPWTFPFIWWASLSLGAQIFSLFGLNASNSLPEVMTFSAFWDMLTNEPMVLVLPWMLGGYLLCVIVTLLTYPLYCNLLKAAKMAQQKARVMKAHQNAKQITGQQK